jgi:hypothetical protein
MADRVAYLATAAREERRVMVVHTARQATMRQAMVEAAVRARPAVDTPRVVVAIRAHRAVDTLRAVEVDIPPVAVIPVAVITND